MDVFETKLSKLKVLLLILGALAFVAMGIWFVKNPETFADSRRGWMVPYIGWASIVFFGLALPIAAKRLFNSKTQIRFDKNGILALPLSPETISWDSIQDVSYKTISVSTSKQKYALLDISPDAQNRIKFSKVYRMSRGPNKSFGLHHPFFILSGYKHSPEEIYSALETAFRKYG